ncbi:MAG TPA: peptidase M28, partial [Gemmata sp.]|nr:peptidase M28 [Gemmata sp.]
MLPGLAKRPLLLAGAFFALALIVTPNPPPVAAAEEAPKPRMAPTDTDEFIINEIATHSQLMKNLQYLSDVIGPRLTGSKNAERANNWTADKMKEYGLVNVHLEPWEIPVGWVRGHARMRLVDPDTGVEIPVAATPWTPGTKGKVTGNVVIVNARTKADLEKYKGKLKNAIVLTSPPRRVRSVSEMYGEGGARNQYPFGGGGEPKKGGGKKDGPGFPGMGTPKTDEAQKQPPKKDDGKNVQPKRQFGGGFQGGGININEFLKAEGAACLCSDSAKPQGLIMTGGRWPNDLAAGEAAITRVSMSNDSYAMLYRLASRENAVTKVEVEVDCKFVAGPVTVFNTVGEVRGSEKPDEIV